MHVIDEIHQNSIVEYSKFHKYCAIQRKQIVRRLETK